MSLPPSLNGLPAGARIDYAPNSAKNGTAYASVVFGVLWLAGLVVPVVVSATSPLGVEPSQLLETCAEFALWFGGPLAIIFGHVGIYRAVRHRELRGSLGWAIAGVLLGYLWLAALFFFTEAGAELLYWVTHLFR
jgi:hypothetical protein